MNYHGDDPAPDDVLVIWNRYGGADAAAERFERRGAPVIVAENGYIGTDETGEQLYALALNHHIGAGWWHWERGNRWASLGIEEKPWRDPTPNGHILICAQRGIGEKGVAMPGGWPQDTAQRLATVTSRPIRLRLHPGNHAPAVPLEADLEGAHCAVVWASGAGIKAVVAGIPVFHDFPRWILAGAAVPLEGGRLLEKPYVFDRSAALERMAWAQWRLSEIETGEPFRHLLDLHKIS